MEIAQQQATISETAAHQSRRIFVLGNWPRVVIDRFEFANPDPGQFPPLNLPTVLVEILNTGGTPAHIEGSGCCYVFQPDGLPPHPAYIANNDHHLFNLNVGDILEPGQSKQTYYPDGTRRVQGRLMQSILSQDQAEEFNASRELSRFFFAIGWISYSDETGISRKTKFARQWDGGRRRFVVVNDPDFEREA